MKSLKFFMKQRQDKGVAFRQALLNDGYDEVWSWREADFILYDHDQPPTDEIAAAGKPVFVHPHAAHSFLLWDGIFQAMPHIACNFVYSQGAADVMRHYGYPYPIEVTGWSLCPVKPFQPAPQLERVLFAPLHPNAKIVRENSRLDLLDIEVNRKTFEILQALPLKHVTIRYWGEIEENGIGIDPRFEYVRAELSVADALKSIKAADLIIGHDTFAFLGVASGKPTVMIGESMPYHSKGKEATHWLDYVDTIRYPFDLLTDYDPLALLQEAARTDLPIEFWRRRFIGPAFDPQVFANTVSRYLREIFGV